jgi:hypothetical protein
MACKDDKGERAGSPIESFESAILVLTCATSANPGANKLHASKYREQEVWGADSWDLEYRV